MGKTGDPLPPWIFHRWQMVPVLGNSLSEVHIRREGNRKDAHCSSSLTFVSILWQHNHLSQVLSEATFPPVHKRRYISIFCLASELILAGLCYGHMPIYEGYAARIWWQGGEGRRGRGVDSPNLEKLIDVCAEGSNTEILCTSLSG